MTDKLEGFSKFDEIVSELRILKNTIDKSSLGLKYRLEDDSDSSPESIEFLENPVSFGLMLSSLIYGIEPSTLRNMSDNDILKLIQKQQLIENDR